MQLASKSAAADDLIKAFVRENCGPSATDTTRNYSSSYWSVAADIGAAPTIAKAASRRNLLTTCQEIAQAATQAGMVAS
jgi:hypothetical protein